MKIILVSFSETGVPVAQVKKYPLRSQVRLGILGTAPTNSVSIATTTQTQRRGGITVVPKKKAKVAASTRNLGKCCAHSVLHYSVVVKRHFAQALETSFLFVLYVIC
jgi:hypothetical protein